MRGVPGADPAEPEVEREPTAEQTLYVSLDDFFGGEPPGPDPILQGWREPDSDKDDDQHPNQTHAANVAAAEPPPAEAPAAPEPPATPEPPAATAAPPVPLAVGPDDTDPDDRDNEPTRRPARAMRWDDPNLETVIRAPFTDEDFAREEARAKRAATRAADEAETNTDTGATAASGTSLARNSAIMAAGTMVSRVLGMLRTALLAACVGLSLVGDAFTVANTLPNYVYILLSAGVLNAILIPQITKAMKRDDGGQAFVDRLLTLALGLVLVAALVGTLASPLLVRLTSNLSGDAYDLAVLFAFICLPQIAFYGIYAILGQVLNVRGQFAAFMWAPAGANVVQIAGLLWFLAAWGKQEDAATVTGPMIWVLAGSTTLGIIVQGLSLIWPLYRGGFRFRPRFDFRGHGLGQGSKILGWTFTALVVAQIGGFVVQKVMTAIRDNQPDVPSVIAHANAFQIFMLPHAFITVSILTALFPDMSRAHHDGDTEQMRSLVKRSLTLPAVGVIPLSVAMMVFAYPGARLMFFRLPPHQAADIAWILAAMAIGTMAFGITTLQQRYCFAREDGRTNLWLQGLLTVVQVMTALLAFAVPARWAVVTIGLGQSTANIVAALVFIMVASRQLGGLGTEGVTQLYRKLTLGAGAAGLVSFGLVWLIGLAGDGLGIALLQLLLGGPFFLVACWMALKRLGVREVDDLVAPVLRRLGRG